MHLVKFRYPAKERINDTYHYSGRMLKVVSMDFITGLPVSEGYDAICVIIDKFLRISIYALT